MLVQIDESETDKHPHIPKSLLPEIVFSSLSSLLYDEFIKDVQWLPLGQYPFPSYLHIPNFYNRVHQEN